MDTLTVSASTWPDNSPLTNWTNYNFPDIEKVVPKMETDTEAWMVPNDTGGYRKDTEETVTLRKWELHTSKTNSYLKRMEHATAAWVTAGTAVRPGNKADNFITGVALFEFQLKSGLVSERWQLWGKLRLEDPGEVGPKTRLVKMSFEEVDNALNSYVLLNS